MSLQETVTYYTEQRGWSEQEAQDNLYLAGEARAHFALVSRHPEPGLEGVRIYVMRDARGYTKVGISNNPAARAHALSAGNPTKVKLAYETEPYSRAFAAGIEAAVHDFLAGASLGREWFKCDFGTAIEAIHLMGGLGEAA